MKTTHAVSTLIAAVAALSLLSRAHADSFGSFTIDFVDIGNAGNANDTVNGAGTNYGAVPYAYRMGVTEVSRDWLAKAGTPGGYPLSGSNLPAWSITWYQAAAFVNYLNTSTGHAAAYNLDSGATSLTLWSSAQAWQAGGENLYRNKDAFYFLPSENEWYKAAYFNPGGSSYNLYPTGSSIPTAVSGGTGAGTAVYDGLGPADVSNAGGLSPYGTMGQGGNLLEWAESASDGVNDTSSEARAFRGGLWDASEGSLRSSSRSSFGFDPAASSFYIGFRVASVPEPSTMVLLIVPGLVWLLKRLRARSL